MPDIEDLGKSLGTLELARIINQTRVNAASNGIHRCKGDMTFFKSNKNDRLLEKRQEL